MTTTDSLRSHIRAAFGASQAFDINRIVYGEVGQDGEGVEGSPDVVFNYEYEEARCKDGVYKRTYALNARMFFSAGTTSMDEKEDAFRAALDAISESDSYVVILTSEKRECFEGKWSTAYQYRIIQR